MNFRNRLQQLIAPGRKVFIIGPHRCATTTLHNFFSKQGLKSIHWRHGDTYLAKEIDIRKNDRRALTKFLMPWTVFSDFVYLTEHEHIENNGLYRRFAEIFPDAYFILNDRDVDRWVSSRLLHRDGRWLSRYLKVHGGTRESAMAKWRDEFIAHRSDVLGFFRGHPRFLHFRIDKEDHPTLLEPSDINELTSLLAPDYKLSAEVWTNFNTLRRTSRGKRIA